MVAEISALAAALTVLAADALHERRIRRLSQLAFGPSGKPQGWARSAPWLRAIAAAGLAWGLTTLLYLQPKVHRAATVDRSKLRHLVVLLDVSPSMALEDAGPSKKQSRRARAKDLIESFLARAGADFKISVVAVYNGAKPVVVDTIDMEVIRNILGDLPMSWAFDVGSTRLFDGLEEVAEIAHPWRPDDATLLVVTDGDTVPASGMPKLPASINHTLIIGSVDALKPRILAELIQQMRGNLAGVWRMPDVQRQNSTNRKQRDIRAEVVHGYEVARKVTRDALQKHPDHWALLLAQAAILHDEIDYEKEAEKSSDFSERRSEAMTLFASAAKSYVAALPEIPIDEQTTLPFEMWFYASLGSVDLARITADKNPDLRQPALIRETLLSLPGESADRHLSQFANNLFTRGTEAKPELKHRYLRAGFEVVGDHKLAREARKLLDYYADLVTEIKLETRIDGSDAVGHGRPFGVFVNLVHTKEIERESGGFGKYLQNQNNPNMYFYNFGRPLENYRDKFQDFATKALSEHFEVISVTFQEASVNSRALPDYGWRTTPYAYLLLKAKGPEVDKLAPLRMDLDFLDTSGYAVLPIESPALPLDARSAAPPRPADQIIVTQTLDERQSDKGKLLLEVRATALGLVPELPQLLDIAPAGFEIAGVDDRGLAVIEFDKDSPDNAVRSERQWTVSLAAVNAEERPKTFQFGAAKTPIKEMIYQRYEDADLKAVESTVSLESKYGKTSWTWPAMLAAAALALIGLGIAAWRAFAPRRTLVAAGITLPNPLTPFTVIGFLRDLEAQFAFDDKSRHELRESVDAIERHFFQSPQPEPPDIVVIADRWKTRAVLPR